MAADRLSELMKASLIPALGLLASTVASPAAEPTEYEQYLLELINRARATPAAEVTRISAEASSQPGYWGSFYGFNSYDGFAGAAGLNEGPPRLGGESYSISSTAKQPLAFNTDMMDAARAYVVLMQNNNSTAHELGGSNVEQRLTDQGYTSEQAVMAGQNSAYPGLENNGTIATSGPFDDASYPGDIRMEALDVIHHGLFADPDEFGRGHRLTMMATDFKESGIAINFGTDGAFSSVYANHVFGHQSGRGPFLTGVAYNDLDADGFYTPNAGEALAGLAVTVFRTGTTTAVASTDTFGSGGYSVIVPEGGTYDLRFVGTGVAQTLSDIRVLDANVKIDAIDPGDDGGGAAAGEFEISSVSIRGADVTITWGSSAGASYRVLVSTDLANWTAITSSDQTASGTTTSYTHANGASVANRFYQVGRLP